MVLLSSTVLPSLLHPRGSYTINILEQGKGLVAFTWWHPSEKKILCRHRRKFFRENWGNVARLRGSCGDRRIKRNCSLLSGSGKSGKNWGALCWSTTCLEEPKSQKQTKKRNCSKSGELWSPNHPSWDVLMTILQILPGSGWSNVYKIDIWVSIIIKNHLVTF